MYLVDGAPCDHLPVDDRGLQFGDGLFETIAIVSGRPCLLERHLARLVRGAEALSLPAPDLERITADVTRLATAGPGCGVVKVVWTAGSGGRGYARPDPVTPRRIVSRHPAPQHPASHWSDGITACLVTVPLARQPHLAGIKHLNRLEQTLARAQWQGAGVAEGLMCDEGGRFIEGTMSNLFVVHGGCVVTPRLDECGIAGVMREAIMDKLAADGAPATEGEVTLETLQEATEVFVCNSVNGVWPVRRIDGVGHWRVGPVSRRLLHWLDREALACTPAGRDEQRNGRA
ncbi:aminodeoxychorismate lyase [Aquisalimonas asiatica]|uniref:Aminodeoxychorismate lyase n=1 Tax=Aquisalimonas asiatica TaxID=406100 RepID=A0A1H8QEG5_9GAMM|nr:aminodeoxychorismate lyase [Aquisalimonas asiatica]SEO52446.1 4-amino-4-deoxychorismate lyase [Aquisalimonas asiatica]